MYEMSITKDNNMRDIDIYSVFTEFNWDNDKFDLYESLWKAVLQRLAFDFLGYKVIVTSATDKPFIIQHAREYIFHHEDFLLICELADIDADTFRNRLVDLLNKNIFR